MIHLDLAPAIVTPGLWVNDPDKVTLDTVIKALDAGDGAVGAEAIADAGGWRSMLVGASWVDIGERPAGMDMDLRGTIRHLIERALEECGGSDIKAAKRLGVNPSTLYRWRHGQVAPLCVAHKRAKLKVVG